MMRYKRNRGIRQAVWMPVLAVIAVSGTVAGCSSVGSVNIPLGDMVVGSTSGTSQAASVPPEIAVSDLSLITSAIDASFDKLPAGEPVGFENPDSGLAGSIAPTGGAATDGARTCRRFTMTMRQLTGIERYRGRACRGQGDVWMVDHILAFQPGEAVPVADEPVSQAS